MRNRADLWFRTTKDNTQRNSTEPQALDALRGDHWAAMNGFGGRSTNKFTLPCGSGLAVSRVKEGHLAVRPADVDPESVVTVFRVPPENAGMRVDLFLQAELHRTSRSRAAQIVKNSAYDMTGKRMRPGARLQAEARIVLWRPPWDEDAPEVDIPVLYEDAELMAVDKPAMMPVHPTARYHKSTLIVRMKNARPGEFLSLGHRLDRETSGLLLLTRSPSCDRSLKRMLEDRAGIEKVYLAIVRGAPNQREFVVELGMMLDPHHSTKVKMCVSSRSEALYSKTRFRVLGVRCRRPLALESVAGDAATPALADKAATYALVECHLETGRQHQIRLHLAHKGYPLVGDKLYGQDDGIFARGADGELTDDDREHLELPRHALHAHRLALPHPTLGHALHVESPLPKDLQTFWDSLEFSAPAILAS
jgi:23S rRNA pseudouridine1911/1915/1917 synthase